MRKGERLEGTERGVRMRGREHKWRERDGNGKGCALVMSREGLARRQSKKEKGM